MENGTYQGFPIPINANIGRKKKEKNGSSIIISLPVCQYTMYQYMPLREWIEKKIVLWGRVVCVLGRRVKILFNYRSGGFN